MHVLQFRLCIPDRMMLPLILLLITFSILSLSNFVLSVSIQNVFKTTICLVFASRTSILTFLINAPFLDAIRLHADLSLPVRNYKVPLSICVTLVSVSDAMHRYVGRRTCSSLS